MPDIVDNMLQQVLVYWPKGTKGRDGTYSEGTPVEIVCRWENRSSELVDSEGSTYMSQAVIYTNDDTIELQGWVWLSDATREDAAGTALAAAPSSPPKNQVVRSVNFDRGLTRDDTEILYTIGI